MMKKENKRKKIHRLVSL
jgi:hypothetical protein